MDIRVHPTPPNRSAGLDAARALAVFAMVLGHCADALLSHRLKDSAAFATYSTFRGMTAPLFLFVSGWAVATRDLRSSRTSAELVALHLRRSVFLGLIALVLRFPAWNVPGLFHGERVPWRHWLGMDALGCIALSLALSAGVLAPPIAPRVKLGLAATLAAAAPWLAGWAAASPPSFPFSAWTLLTPDSPFPIVPWSGFFFGGVAVGAWLHEVRSAKVRALGLLLVGLVGLSGAEVLGLDRLVLWSPILFVYRLGFASSVGGVMLALKERWIRWCMPIGRASLVTYILHVPLLYGWGTLPGLRDALGPALALWQVALVALIFVAIGVSIRGQRRSETALA